MQIKQKNQKKKFEIFFFTCFPQVYIYHFMYTGWVFLMFMMDFTYYLECSIVHNACTLCKDDAPKWYVKGSLCLYLFIIWKSSQILWLSRYQHFLANFKIFSRFQNKEYLFSIPGWPEWGGEKGRWCAKYFSGHEWLQFEARAKRVF